MVREQMCIPARACNTQYASMPCRVSFTVAAVNGYAMETDSSIYNPVTFAESRLAELQWSHQDI